VHNAEGTHSRKLAGLQTRQGIKDFKNKTRTTLQSLPAGFILAYATEEFPNRIVESRGPTYICYLATPFSETAGSFVRST